MKRQMLTLILLACVLLPLAAQGGQHSNNHQYFPPNGGSHGSAYLQQIEQRLDLLEARFVPRLPRPQRQQAKAMINEIRGLLQAAMLSSGYGQYWPGQDRRPMAPEDFGELKNRVKRSVFGDDAIRLISLAATGNYFSARQIASLLDELTFADDQLEALEILYPRCVDRSGNFLILDVFTFSSDREAAERILSRIT